MDVPDGSDKLTCDIIKVCLCLSQSDDFTVLPVSSVLKYIVANVHITAHRRTASIATITDPEGLHGLKELRLLQPEHLSVEQLVQKS